jgi:hypothetical protein
MKGDLDVREVAGVLHQGLVRTGDDPRSGDSIQELLRFCGRNADVDFALAGQGRRETALANQVARSHASQLSNASDRGVLVAADPGVVYYEEADVSNVDEIAKSRLFTRCQRVTRQRTGSKTLGRHGASRQRS